MTVPLSNDSHSYHTASATVAMPCAPVSASPEASPNFRLVCVGGAGGPQVRIEFASKSPRGIWIESRRLSGDWDFVIITPERPYLDWRLLLDPPQGEVREYRARYFEPPAPKGPWSPTQRIAIEPREPSAAGEMSSR